MCVCVCVSVCVYLSTIISSELHVRSSPNFLCMLPMAVVRFFSGGAGIHYVLPVGFMDDVMLAHKQGCSTSPPSWSAVHTQPWTGLWTMRSNTSYRPTERMHGTTFRALEVTSQVATRGQSLRSMTVRYTGWVKKSKLLILSKYVNKTEDMRNVNKYKQLQRKWSIFWYFHVKYLRHNCFMFKYSVTESCRWNYCARQTRTTLRKYDVIKLCSIEYLTTEIEQVLPTFKFWTVHKIIIEYLTLGGSVAEWLACWTQSQSRRCRVTVLGKLFTHMCFCSPSSKIGSSPVKSCVGNCGPGGK